MFFQIKAIRKGSKPPIWRRAWIPSNITFTQLALILEIILEYPESAQYEFEFFQKKDRIIEWQDEDEGIHDYYYSYLNAPDTFVNDWLLNEKWFTFRLRGQKDAEYPDYRVEIEKAFDKIRDKNRDSEEIVLNSPILVKETSPKNDRFWTRQKEIVPILEKAYVFRESEPEYLYLEELRRSIAAGQGLAVCADPVSRDIHTQKSFRAILKEIGDKVWDPVISPRLEALKKELGYDETTDTFQASEDETEEAIAKFMDEMVPELRNAVRQAVAGTVHNSQKSGTAKEISLEDVLKSYTKQDLLEIADEFDLSLKNARKDTMAYQLTRQLLEPQTMRELLTELSEEELDAFEAAMEKGRFFPSESEERNLAAVYDMIYIAEYTNGFYQVPEDVIHVYNILKRTGYRELHKKCRWLINCLDTFALMHVVAPERILCRMYQQNKAMQADSEEMFSLMEQIPDRLNPCRRISGKIVVKGAVRDRVYEELERQQRNTTYYIPTESEINSIAEKGFPESEKAYRDLEAFYKKELRLDDEDTEYFCSRAFVVFCSGGMLSDYIEYLNEEEIEFQSDRQVRRFADLMMQVNNNTRMYILKGHTPNEMASKRPKGGRPRPTAIGPMSSMAAQMLEESRDQLAAMGVNVDTDSTADIIPMAPQKNSTSGMPVVSSKKIYPNDPCPCGSGKKYKKCCGRNK